MEECRKGNRCTYPYRRIPVGTPRIDELAMDGLREDDEVIDAEYREVDTQEEKSEIDDYAIPDEPDSYAVNRKAAELRYIKPIDYADRVAAMDKDLEMPLRYLCQNVAVTHHSVLSLWMWCNRILHLCQISWN